MEIDGKARVRRAREPIVPDALRSRPAERTRMRVASRRGRELFSGAPRRDISCLEKVSIAGRRSSTEFWIMTPPHCGINQLLPPPSISISPT